MSFDDNAAYRRINALCIDSLGRSFNSKTSSGGAD